MLGWPSGLRRRFAKPVGICPRGFKHTAVADAFSGAGNPPPSVFLIKKTNNKVGLCV